MTNPVDGRLQLFREASSHYALTMLPSSETLIEWAETITTYQEKRTIGLQQAIDNFLLKYAKLEQDLPMVRERTLAGRPKHALTDVPEIFCHKSPPAQLPGQDPLGSGAEHQ